MKAMYSKIPSVYTIVFPYTVRFSVRASSEKDVNLSFNEMIVGKNGKAHQGDKVLICGHKDNGVYVFGAIIGKSVTDERVKTWHNKGGNLWNYNYEIHNKTQQVFLTWEEVSKITGAEGTDVKRVFLDRYRPRNQGTKITRLGSYRDILFGYLEKR